MKLKHLVIKNFRGIRTLKITVSDFISLIGPNNSGKTSIMRAMEILLNNEKPTLDDWRKGSQTEPIEIIGVFTDIQDWEREKPGVSGLIDNSKIILRAQFVNDGEKISVTHAALIRRMNIAGWDDAWGQLGAEIKKIAQEMSIMGATWKSKANKQRVRDFIAQNRPDLVTVGNCEWTSESVSIPEAFEQALPQAVIIHAVTDASEELKPVSKTAFNLLLKRIVIPAIQGCQEYKTLMNAVTAMSQKMGQPGDEGIKAVTDLANDLTDTIKDIVEGKVRFNLTAPDTEKFIGSSTGIKLDDGIETPPHLQGHGIQRALIFAMIERLAKNTSETGEKIPHQRSTILLFEEPELYLHPHLMRRLKNSLQRISKRPDWQVVISTHSPFFITVADDPTSLVILHKPSHTKGTIKKQLSKDPFGDADKRDEREALRAALDFHPTVSEAFFANKTILVEGDTEVAVLKHGQEIYKSFGIEQSKYDATTIVCCSGKWTIPAIARVLQEFKIDFKIIHDIDRKDRTQAQLAQAAAIDPYKANQKIKNAADKAPIYQVDDTFEHILWSNKDDIKSGDKPFRAWERIKEIQKNTNSPEFNKLKEIFEFAYNWQ